jgi:ferredoxin-NADP reductase
MSFVSAATVSEVVEHAADVREFRLSPDRPRRYEAGAFLQLALEPATASEVWPDSRTFSIASHGQDRMTLIVQRVGPFTSRMFETLRPGSRCTVKYPFGDLFDRRTADARHVLLAGGLGITPFFGMLDFFRASGGLDRVDLLYSVRREAELLYPDRLAADLGDRARFFVTREPPVRCSGRRFRADDAVACVPSPEEAHYYLCGSKEFIASLAADLAARGCRNVHRDEWE